MWSDKSYFSKWVYLSNVYLNYRNIRMNFIKAINIEKVKYRYIKWIFEFLITLDLRMLKYVKYVQEYA